MNKQQERYQQDIRITCERLNIAYSDYVMFRNYGNRIHRLYENECNGFQDANFNWDTEAEKENGKKIDQWVRLAKKKAQGLGLYIFFQTDPRGATIYLSKNPIPENSYNTSAECIY